MLAYAEDKAGNRTLLGSSTGDSVISQPTVCLVNENTASAAELFASSLRTLCGTRLVGSTTMGKGTIQSSPQRLSDGSAVVVTVAKLICGDGSCFDGTGLTVDVERPLTATSRPATMTTPSTRTRRYSAPSAAHSSSPVSPPWAA